MYTSQHKMAKKKPSEILSQSEHNRLDNNSTNFTVQNCTKLCLSLSYLSAVKENDRLLSLFSVITRLSVLTCPVRSEAQTVST